MTRESVNQFLTKVGAEEELQAELAQAIKVQNEGQSVLKMAAKYGYDFTSEDLVTEMLVRDVISEDELESVAGGIKGIVKAAKKAKRDKRQRTGSSSLNDSDRTRVAVQQSTDNAINEIMKGWGLPKFPGT